MWLNPQETADLITFTEEILKGQLHFLCSEYNRMDNFLTQDRSCLKIIFLPLSKQQLLGEWSRPIAFPLQYLIDKQFFCMYFVSRIIILAKHMVKQGEAIFFSFGKKFESSYFIDK